jgi:hypothetical protein
LHDFDSSVEIILCPRIDRAGQPACVPPRRNHSKTPRRRLLLGHGEVRLGPGGWYMKWRVDGSYPAAPVHQERDTLASRASPFATKSYKARHRGRRLSIEMVPATGVLGRGRLHRARARRRAKDYIQHNPVVPTGRKGFMKFFAALGSPIEIQPTIRGALGLRTEIARI